MQTKVIVFKTSLYVRSGTETVMCSIYPFSFQADQHSLQACKVLKPNTYVLEEIITANHHLATWHQYFQNVTAKGTQYRRHYDEIWNWN